MVVLQHFSGKMANIGCDIFHVSKWKTEKNGTGLLFRKTVSRC